MPSRDISPSLESMATTGHWSSWKCTKKAHSQYPWNTWTCSEKLKQIGLTTLEDHRTRGGLIETFKIIHNVSDVNPAVWFSHSTRQTSFINAEGFPQPSLNIQTRLQDWIYGKPSSATELYPPGIGCPSTYRMLHLCNLLKDSITSGLQRVIFDSNTLLYLC